MGPSIWMPHGLQTISRSGLPQAFCPQPWQVNLVLEFAVPFGPCLGADCKFSFQPTRRQLGVSLAEHPAWDDVVRHASAGFLAADHAGVRRHQPDRLHLCRPFFVVIPARRRRAAVVLPGVNHLMHQRLQNLFVGLPDEGVGVEREFVAIGERQRSVAAGKTERRKVTDTVRLPLVRYENIRQHLGEQRGVEMLVSRLESGILDLNGMILVGADANSLLRLPYDLILPFVMTSSSCERSRLRHGVRSARSADPLGCWGWWSAAALLQGTWLDI